MLQWPFTNTSAARQSVSQKWIWRLWSKKGAMWFSKKLILWKYLLLFQWNPVANDVTQESTVRLLALAQIHHCQSAPNAFSVHQFPDERKNIILIRDFLDFIHVFSASLVYSEREIDEWSFTWLQVEDWSQVMASAKWLMWLSVLRCD